MKSDYEAITAHNEKQLGLDTASRKTQICMYSDSTHFIYEILQNADDHGATEVSFHLTKGELVIEHNGSPFVEKNVKAITYFGNSTSREDLVKTGRFGVGFKSVFAFTASPTIISGCEHFQIFGLYRVREHPCSSNFDASRTQITIPFNHEIQKPNYVDELMSPTDAYEKIASRLSGLNMHTLLFTRNIRKIRWAIDGESGHYLREDAKNTFGVNSRITTLTNGNQTDTYLVFDRTPHWKGKDYKAVEIAFGLDANKQITSIRDFLYVLFPTTQDTRLHFILNGPFRTNPSRETIDEKDHFNVFLMEETCALMQEVLPEIKKSGLLTRSFLAILPNGGDEVPPLLKPIFESVVRAFKDSDLLPTANGKYVRAKSAMRGDRAIRDVISAQDLCFLTDKDELLWAVDVPVDDKRASAFLEALGLAKFSWKELVQSIGQKCKRGWSNPNFEVTETWLKSKDGKWLGRFYALLDKAADETKSYYGVSYDLVHATIIRLASGAYTEGSSRPFFSPTMRLPRGLEFPSLDESVFDEITEKQSESARSFLKKVGVKEVTDEEVVTNLLETFYGEEAVDVPDAHLQHIKLFMDWSDKAKKFDVFEGSLLFRNADEKLCSPDHIYLDAPFNKTGLAALFGPQWRLQHPRWPLWAGYLDKLDGAKLAKFAGQTGAISKLLIEHTQIGSSNPKHSKLCHGWGHVRRTSTEVDRDFWITNLDKWLSKPTQQTSLLVWEAMAAAAPETFMARYRPNADYKHREEPSLLIVWLKSTAWILNRAGEFKMPADLSRETLHPDFKFDEGYGWLTKIGFGDNVQRATQAYADRVKMLSDFDVPRKLADKLMSLSGNERQQLFFRLESDLERSVEFPEKSVPDIQRRTTHATELARKATPRTSETRNREVRVTKGEVDAHTWLRQEYTNEAGVMFCQMQGSAPKIMPFKYPDENGKFYFDACEFLGDLTVELRANYLALSPDCAAEFKHACQLTDDEKRERVLAIDPNGSTESLILELNTPVHGRLRFTQAHLVDLQAAIRALR